MTKRTKSRKRGKRGRILRPIGGPDQASKQATKARARRQDRRIAEIIEIAHDIGFKDFLVGSCGPAAVAINRVLCEGKGAYTVLTDTSSKRAGTRCGHVAVRYGTSLFDYQGRCTLDKMADFAYDRPFEILSHVREATVVRHFCPTWCLPIENAVEILTQAKAIRESPDPKKAARVAVRAKAKHDADERLRARRERSARKGRRRTSVQGRRRARAS